MNAVRIAVGGALGGGSASVGMALWGLPGAAACFGCAMVAWLAGIILWAVE